MKQFVIWTSVLLLTVLSWTIVSARRPNGTARGAAQPQQPADGRIVRFLAISDIHSTNATHPHFSVMDAAIQKLPPDPSSHHRGLIIAGDLIWDSTTGNWDEEVNNWNGTPYLSACTRPVWWNPTCEPYGNYEDRIWTDRPQRDYIYDGWGNHDQAADAPIPPSDPSQVTAWQDIFETLKARARDGQYPADPNGHYSWDWDGIHFVHLNLVAGDTVISGLGDPMQSLTFLRNDLSAHAAGKPVVIVQHAPPNDIKLDEQQAFIEALQPHRVVAILFGHWHSGVSDSWYNPWLGIEGFDVGAAYDGYWVDVTLTEGTHDPGSCSTMLVNKYVWPAVDPSAQKLVNFPDLDKPVATAQVQGEQDNNCYAQVSLTAVDPGDPRDWGCSSGIEMIQYQIGTGPWTTYTGPFTVTGRTNVYYRAQDRASNWSDTHYVGLVGCVSFLPLIMR